MDVRSILDALQIRYTVHDRYFKTKCLNHPTPDTHPSMTILKESGYFRCWSCGFRGPLVKLLKLFPEYKFNLQEELFVSALPDSEVEEPGFTIGRIHSVEGNIQQIWDSPQVMTYLEERCPINRQWLKDFGVVHLVNARVNGTPAIRRIGVPLYFNGELVSMELRSYDGAKPKVLYPKNASASFLFNSDRLDLQQMVYMTEGVFDTPSLYVHSRNVTAPFGVSLSRLHRIQIAHIPKLCILPDNDEPGEEFLREVYHIRKKEFLVARMPGSVEDPGKATPEEVGYALRNPITSAEWYLRYYLPIENELQAKQAQDALWLS